ncbi:hypothetical protein EBB56_21710 [Halomonas sp. YLB-10]|uniref:hypothetical protein n=1 Tax=Halomonas sp. YLB-10 TaxID=2483111 RepID=UPI000F602785|nr:hypothetical protein [Halomonas sp. YLB-10]RQW68642.1 hypothetical protein EBB56_21710 [Halomonas sp. YLB-10]
MTASIGWLALFGTFRYRVALPEKRHHWSLNGTEAHSGISFFDTTFLPDMFHFFNGKEPIFIQTIRSANSRPDMAIGDACFLAIVVGRRHAKRNLHGMEP